MLVEIGASIPDLPTLFHSFSLYSVVASVNLTVSRWLATLPGEFLKSVRNFIQLSCLVNPTCRLAMPGLEPLVSRDLPTSRVRHIQDTAPCLRRTAVCHGSDNRRHPAH